MTSATGCATIPQHADFEVGGRTVHERKAQAVFGFPMLPILFDDPERTPQETAFLRSIMENPDDDALRLVYADWLEETGQSARAAFVRLEVEFNSTPVSDARAQALRDELDRLGDAIPAGWTFALTRPATLLNCGGEPRSSPPEVRFAFRCEKRWADLRPTADAAIRHCQECRKNVYACDSKEAAQRHALRGECIAISSRLALDVENQYGPRPTDEELIGLPMSPYEVWANELFERHRKRWWQFWR